jgi:hypothetical protein
MGAIMQRLCAVIVGLSVAACTPSFPLVVVSPAPASAGEPRPAKDVIDTAAVTPRDGAGVILVTRPRAWRGRHCTFDVVLDDQPVAGLRSGEKLAIYADPGRRVIDVSVRDDAGCDPAYARLPLDVVSHATSTVRVGSDSRYDLKLDVNTYGGSLRD